MNQSVLCVGQIARGRYVYRRREHENSREPIDPSRNRRAAWDESQSKNEDGNAETAEDTGGTAEKATAPGPGSTDVSLCVGGMGLLWDIIASRSN